MPGHEKISGFYKNPIDPARPRYELVRGLGLFLVGAMFIAIAIVLRQKTGLLIGLGVYTLFAGIWPLVRLAEYGAGRFIWVIASIGTLLHFIDGPTLAMFGFRSGQWLLALNIALGSGVCAGLLAGVWKLTSLAFHSQSLDAGGHTLDDRQA